MAEIRCWEEMVEADVEAAVEAEGAVVAVEVEVEATGELVRD